MAIAPISSKDARKTLTSAYHNKVVTWADSKLIREATQGLSRFEGSPPAPRKA